jgi:hypothetical protein
MASVLMGTPKRSNDVLTSTMVTRWTGGNRVYRKVSLRMASLSNKLEIFLTHCQELWHGWWAGRFLHQNINAALPWQISWHVTRLL